ncbi:MAG: type VI secretion system protein [Deltaproteobacteria bacterium]
MARLRRDAPTPPHEDAIPEALRRLAGVPAARALAEATAHLSGAGSVLLEDLPVASEAMPLPGALDGRLLDALAARALRGARGAVFTASEEGCVLAAFGLAAAAERRGGPGLAGGVAALLGAERASPTLRGALDGLVLLDPACGGGALLAAAQVLAGAVGARLDLRGLDLSPIAVRATSARLALLGVDAVVRRGDALSAAWPACDLLLMNPPFLRHEAMPPAWKERAVQRTGLSRQADLSAHLVRLALRHAPVCGLVLPRALEVSRSAAPLRDEAARRGGFRLAIRSRAAGSFAASVETSLAVWVEGAAAVPGVEATVPLAELTAQELADLASGRPGRRIRVVRPARRAPAGARKLSDVCEVRFGIKTGANGFFHLQPLGGDRYRSGVAGEVRLEPGDVAPLLSGLRDAIAPEVARLAWVLFRPGDPSARALAYVRLGEELGVNRRASCAARRPWWRIAPGRSPAPVLYPAKVGTRAFAFHNREGLLEDKKWHALFPREIDPWWLALLLSATPLRLAVERGARQLTGSQAIADIDAGVLAAIPFPDPDRLGRVEETFRLLHVALARDPVTTDLPAMLDRPAQRELDLATGALLGLSPRAVERERRDLRERTAERLARGAAVRRAIAREGRGAGAP